MKDIIKLKESWKMKTTTSVREATLHAFKGPEYLVQIGGSVYRFINNWQLQKGQKWIMICPSWMDGDCEEFTLLDPPAPKMTDEEWAEKFGWDVNEVPELLQRVREIVKEEMER